MFSVKLTMLHENLSLNVIIAEEDFNKKKSFHGEQRLSEDIRVSQIAVCYYLLTG